MNKILKLIKREFYSKVFTRGFLIATVLGPILMVGIVLAPAFFITLTTEDSVLIGLVDYGGNVQEKLSDTFPDTLKSGVRRLIFSPITPSDYDRNPEN